MAGNWHYKTNLKEDHLGVSEAEAPELKVGEDIQMSKKNFSQMVSDWFAGIDFKKSFVTVLKTFAFVLPLVATFFLVSEAQKKQSLNSNAGANQAKVFFQANSITIPPDSTVQMLVNTDGPVGFLRAEVTFDPAKVKLSKDIDVSNSPLKKVVSITPFAEANTTGRLIVVLGLDPTIATGPSGDFQIGTLSLVSATTNPNVSGTVNYDTIKSQIVNTDATIFSITAINLSVLLNPVATASPVPTPVATATAVSTPAPTAVSTPVVRSCNSCHKGQCDGVCSKSDDRSRCADCN